MGPEDLRFGETSSMLPHKVGFELARLVGFAAFADITGTTPSAIRAMR